MFRQAPTDDGYSFVTDAIPAISNHLDLLTGFELKARFSAKVFHQSKHIRTGVKLALFLCLLIPGTAGAASYTLTVGTVGSGMVIPDNTNNPHPAGVVITITATPDAGWYFANWSGDTNGSVNPLQVTMNSNLSITGNFLAFPTYALTLVTNGQGTIALNPPGGSYLSNSVVTATATPATGWVFAGWSGGTNSSVNPLTLTLNASLSLTGTFAQLPAFDVQPQGVTNVVGSTVSFTSHAVGTAPMIYQWFFADGLLTSATNATLTLTNIQSTNDGYYYIIATNNYGSATSSVVALVVTNSIGTTNVVHSADEASLRAAIQIGGWVGIGFNGTVTIASTINITNNVVLDGSGVSATISGGNAVRLFYVAPGASLSVTNLTLANGLMSVNGGLILTNGVGIGAPADAGAIYNDQGTVTLTACTVTNNSAQALYVGGVARGGAIFNSGGILSLFQTAISNNSAIGGGINGGTSLNGTNFGLGGAIYNTQWDSCIDGVQYKQQSLPGTEYHDNGIQYRIFEWFSSASCYGECNWKRRNDGRRRISGIRFIDHLWQPRFFQSGFGQPRSSFRPWIQLY